MRKIKRETAKKKGLKKYFEGESCCNGHIAERYVSTGACIECLRKYRMVREAKQALLRTGEWVKQGRVELKTTKEACIRTEKGELRILPLQELTLESRTEKLRRLSGMGAELNLEHLLKLEKLGLITINIEETL